MNVPPVWLDKLEIRELIERSMRYIDDRASGRLAELFAMPDELRAQFRTR